MSTDSTAAEPPTRTARTTTDGLPAPSSERDGTRATGEDTARAPDATPAPGPAPDSTGQLAPVASDLLASWLRTTVPAIWGATVTAVLTAVGPHLPSWAEAPLGAALGDESTTLLVTVAAVAGWHATWRSIEAHVPPWLARAALGSSRRPSYAARSRDDAGDRRSVTTQGLSARAGRPSSRV